jgi:hypothetical protein
MSYRIEIDYRVLNKIDMCCKYKNEAFSLFNEYIEALEFKDKMYKNNMRKIWLSKTDYKYVKFFLSQLRCESIPFEVIKLK